MARSPETAPLKRTRGALVVAGYKGAGFVARTMPEWAAERSAHVLAVVLRQVLKGRRNMVGRHQERLTGRTFTNAERIIALAVGLAVPVLLVPVLWLMLVLVSLTAVQRFVKVWRQAAKPPAPIILPPRAARSARTRGANADRAFWSARSARTERPPAERSPWRDRAATRRNADPTSKAFAEWRDRLKQRR